MWNSDGFDIPYTINRLKVLLKDPKGTKVGELVSKFGIIKERYKGESGSKTYDLPDYATFDMMVGYKPRSEGGLHYGKSQASYSLDHISDIELDGLKKINYNEEGYSLDNLYEKDPITFLTYNIADVTLPKKINDKLQHIGLHNLLRRSTFDSFQHSKRGQSSFFSAYYSSMLNRNNKLLKYNTVSETRISLSNNEIQNIPIPKLKSINLSGINSLSESEYSSVVNSFPGAYVKDIEEGILITSKDGISIDLDAKLYWYTNIEIYYDIIIFMKCWNFNNQQLDI